MSRSDMYLARRLPAVIVDIVFTYASWRLAVMGSTLLFHCTTAPIIIVEPVMLAVFSLWPGIVLLLPTAIWGRTPGKVFFCLNVVDFYGRRLGFWRSLAREMIKVATIMSIWGIPITFFVLVKTKRTWYDEVCRTTVNTVRNSKFVAPRYRSCRQL